MIDEETKILKMPHSIYLCYQRSLPWSLVNGRELLSYAIY